MAYNENVQLEFSLDQKETYLASGLTKKAEEYTNLFRYKRQALIIQGKYGITDNVFDQKKYDELLNTRGIVYATEYKQFFLLKKEILRIKEFLGFQKELGDENVVVDDEIKPVDDDEIEIPDVEKNKGEEDIERLREKYKEKYGKEVAVGYKNNIEWIKKKLL